MTHRTAVIDLGSNTSRLVSYEHEPGGRFRLVDGVREVVRLREGMGASQTLRCGHRPGAPRAQDAAHAVRCRGVDELVTTATSAVRDATNRDSFIARVGAE